MNIGLSQKSLLGQMFRYDFVVSKDQFLIVTEMQACPSGSGWISGLIPDVAIPWSVVGRCCDEPWVTER